MPLTGPQKQEIQKALLAAFDEAALTQMVQFQLDETLAQIAGGDDLTAIVFSLVNWADHKGRVLDLIDGALAENPENSHLHELQQAASNWHLEPAEEGDPPYQGLQYFDVGDADRFFGREHLTAQLVGYLRDHRLLAVIGASGSGKSSVVRAGVVPALTAGKELADGTLPPKGSTDWLVHILTPTTHPLKALSASLTRGSESVTAQATLIDDMSKDARSIDLFVSRMLADSPTDHLLLVVDQFEELFTQCKNPDLREVFVDNLLAAAQADGPTTVIITLRADFYHRCAEFDDLRMALANGQTYSDGNSWIEAMSPSELRAAIEKPAVLGDWDFEPGLVDVMLADVEHEPGALPLLSHALLETWNNRRGRTMTFAGYYAAGGVKGAIATRADAEFNELDASEQSVARNIFVRLTELGEGSEDTRRRVSREELLGTGKDAETVTKVLTTLGYARLITVDQDEVEVAHEALIREWPTLRGWLEDDREGLRTHRRLTEMATAWDDAGRKADDLDRGTRLEQTVAWAESNEGAMNNLERDFLHASTEQVEAERREKARVAQEREDARERELKVAQALAAEAEAREQVETQRAEESEQSARRLRRRSSWLGAALVVALAAIVATGYFFIEAQRNADMASVNEHRAQINAEDAQINERRAQNNAGLAEDRLRQFGSAISGLGVDQLAAIVQELVLVDDIDGATVIATTAIEFDPDLIASLNPNELSDSVVQIFVSAVSRRVKDLEANESSEPAANLLESVRGLLDFVELERASFVDSNGARYVLIPAGQFVMGSGSTDNLARSNESAHSVNLDEYWIMQTEVTNGQYQRCVDEGICTAPNNNGWNNPANAQRPVTDVSWPDADTYAGWVGGRLPTEAEWEKACRSIDGRIYPWGDAEPTEALLNYARNVGETTDVGAYPPGANYLYDMAGNAWEWTADWYDGNYYANSSENNPRGPESGDVHTLRGGAWYYFDDIVRCAFRTYLDYPDFRFSDVGFRVVRHETAREN